MAGQAGRFGAAELRARRRRGQHRADRDARRDLAAPPARADLRARPPARPPTPTQTAACARGSTGWSAGSPSAASRSRRPLHSRHRPASPPRSRRRSRRRRLRPPLRLKSPLRKRRCPSTPSRRPLVTSPSRAVAPAPSATSGDLDLSGRTPAVARRPGPGQGHSAGSPGSCSSDKVQVLGLDERALTPRLPRRGIGQGVHRGRPRRGAAAGAHRRRGRRLAQVDARAPARRRSPVSKPAAAEPPAETHPRARARRGQRTGGRLRRTHRRGRSASEPAPIDLTGAERPSRRLVAPVEPSVPDLPADDDDDADDSGLAGAELVARELGGRVIGESDGGPT